MGSIASRFQVLYSVRNIQTGSDAHLASGAKWPEFEMGRSSEVKNECIHTSNLSYIFIPRSGIVFSFVVPS